MLRLFSIKAEQILERVPEEEIFLRYANLDPKSAKTIKNPLRDDNSPGCKFFRGSNGRLLFYDFSNGRTWDCFRLSAEILNINYQDMLYKINEDFGLKLDTSNPTDKVFDSPEIEPVKKTSIIPKFNKNFSKKELEYWKQFGITKTILKKYLIKSVDVVYANERIFWRSTPSNPIFFYQLGDKYQGKLYRPLTKDRKEKWLSIDCPKFQGLDQLPYSGDLLIITSSLKDVMTLQSLGYNAIAPQSESADLGELRYVTLMFNRTIIFYDNDEAGKLNAAKWEYESICLDDEKDISDYYKKYGRWKTKQKMWTLLKHSSKPSTNPGVPFL